MAAACGSSEITDWRIENNCFVKAAMLTFRHGGACHDVMIEADRLDRLVRLSVPNVPAGTSTASY